MGLDVAEVVRAQRVHRPCQDYTIRSKEQTAILAPDTLNGT